VTPDEVIAAVRRLVDAGHAEIVLTGVDMTSWGGDLDGAPRLGRLVGAILDAVPDLFRLRLSSVDCAEIDAELFERLTADPRLAPYLHLSLQSGDNLILKRMKRRHTREDAIALAESLRARRKGFALGADFIAGFPTETDDMADASLRLIDEAGLNFVHVFPYSPREGTPAARMPQLNRAVIAERARALRAAGAAATIRLLNGLVGSEDDVVLESGGRARLGNFALMKLENAGGAGTVVRARVLGREGETLIGARAA
jgi:threonylcarbamoyladenosine tRNA methylthiotransferase MtaB